MSTKQNKYIDYFLLLASFFALKREILNNSIAENKIEPASLLANGATTRENAMMGP